MILLRKTEAATVAETISVSTLMRPAFVAQRTRELTYLHDWLARIHPEQLREENAKQIGSSDFVRRNLDTWAARP